MHRATHFRLHKMNTSTEEIQSNWNKFSQANSFSFLSVEERRGERTECRESYKYGIRHAMATGQAKKRPRPPRCEGIAPTGVLSKINLRHMQPWSSRTRGQRIMLRKDLRSQGRTAIYGRDCAFCSNTRERMAYASPKIKSACLKRVVEHTEDIFSPNANGPRI